MAVQPIQIIGYREEGYGESASYVPVYSDTPEGFVRTSVTRTEGENEYSQQFDVDVRGVTSAYQQNLGRAPTQDELASAAQRLAQGGSVGNITEGITQTDEYLDRQLMLEEQRRERETTEAERLRDEQFKAEQARLEAENQARIDALNAGLLDLQTQVTDEAGAARLEIERLLAAEQESLRQLQAEFAAQQAAAQAAADAAAAQAAEQQAALQRQIDEANRQAAEAAERFRQEREGMQRESAERVAAGRRAGRTAVARPLMAGVDATPMAASGSLGGGGSFGGGAGTLGAATALGG